MAITKTRELLFLCALIFFLFPTIASSKGYDLDKSVMEIQERYQSISDLTASFTQQSYIEILEKNVEKRGRIYLKKEGKLKIEYNEKGSKQYISDGKTLKVFVPGDSRTLQVFPLSERDIPKEALSFLLGFGNLKEEFKITPSESYDKLEPNFVALHLIPKDKHSNFKSLDAVFNNEKLLVSLMVANVSGNTTTYNFSDIKVDTGLDDKMFNADF